MTKPIHETVRLVTSAFGTLAAALHLPPGCCGVGAIEAQVAADDGDGSTSEESSSAFAVNGEGIPGSSPSGAVDQHSRSGKTRASTLRMVASDKDTEGLSKGRSKRGRRGFVGLLSPSRSLGWKKRYKGDDNSQSEKSQFSTMSILSGGLKLLASKGAKILQLGRKPPRVETSADGFSEMTWSNDGSDVDTCDEEHPRGRLLWRHVRTIVQGVRGEGSGLEGTVRHRAARRIQGMVRMKFARGEALSRRALARLALQYGQECRLRRRQRDADARRRYKEACREEGKRVLEWSIKCFLQPRAILDLQRVWRGFRARKRLATYLKWLEARARRRREYERYCAALAARNGPGDRSSEQTKRRVWGRVDFTHTGWRPRYDVENPPRMHDHIWTPPRGSSSGVRTLKVLLPPGSERDRRTLTEDKNAWAGVPVGIAKRSPPPERLGAPPRPGTITGDRSLPSSTSVDERGVELAHVVTQYNWLPARLIAKAELLQARPQNHR